MTTESDDAQRIVRIAHPVAADLDDDAALEASRNDAVERWWYEVASQRVRAAEEPQVRMWAHSDGHHDWDVRGAVTTWPIAGYRLVFKRLGESITVEAATPFTAAWELVHHPALIAQQRAAVSRLPRFPVLVFEMAQRARVVGHTYRSAELMATIDVEAIEI